MSTQKQKNPPRNIEKRSSIPRGSQRFNQIINNLMHEFSKSNPSYYCPTCHSVETRKTILQRIHSKCKEPLTKTEVTGPTFESTVEIFMNVCDEDYVDENDRLTDVYFSIYDSQATKTRAVRTKKRKASNMAESESEDEEDEDEEEEAQAGDLEEEKKEQYEERKESQRKPAHTLKKVKRSDNEVQNFQPETLTYRRGPAIVSPMELEQQLQQPQTQLQQPQIPMTQLQQPQMPMTQFQQPQMPMSQLQQPQMPMTQPQSQMPITQSVQPGQTSVPNSNPTNFDPYSEIRQEMSHIKRMNAQLINGLTGLKNAEQEDKNLQPEDNIGPSQKSTTRSQSKVKKKEAKSNKSTQARRSSSTGEAKASVSRGRSRQTGSTPTQSKARKSTGQSQNKSVRGVKSQSGPKLNTSARTGASKKTGVKSVGVGFTKIQTRAASTGTRKKVNTIPK